MNLGMQSEEPSRKKECKYNGMKLAWSGMICSPVYLIRGVAEPFGVLPICIQRLKEAFGEGISLGSQNGLGSVQGSASNYLQKFWQIICLSWPQFSDL